MRKIIAIITILTGLSLTAQNALKPYQWRDHLPYNQAYSVTNQGNTIFVASNECAFSYNKNDGTYARLNKVSGYSDIEPVIIKNNPYNNALMIIYANSNIDILKGGTITNVADLYRKQNIGDKTVSSVTFSGPLAYLACGFGIVVFNTETFEFKDTYIIGPNATNEFVYQVALSDTEIYAATKTGIFQASLNSSNLASYTNWSLVSSLPAGPYNGIVYFNGNIITNYSAYILTGIMKDTLFQYNGTNWSKYPFKQYTLAGNNPPGTYQVKKMIVSDDKTKFITTDQYGFEAFDGSGNNVARIWGFGFPYTSVEDVIPDPTQPNWYWSATSTNGLLYSEYVSGNQAQNVQNFQINGPITTPSSDIAIKDDKMIVAPAFLDLAMYNGYDQNPPFYFQDNTWSQAVKQDTAAIFDINSVIFDPNDASHYYGGSWWNGLVEYKNDKEIGRYDYTNSALYPDYTDTILTRVGGLAFDNNNNLWIGMGLTQHLLSAKKPDGTFVSLDFTQTNSVNNSPGPLPLISHVIIDSTQQVWAVAYGIGLFVYKYDGTFTTPIHSNSIKLTNIVGQGGLPSTEVISIALDRNNDVWVGTDQGIYVFYNPESIFTQSSGWDAQPIYIQQDGLTQLLLQTDEVMCIAVDGANNKWCGTRTSGLYCFSPDGQTELYHFTVDNSPLFSNSINTVKVNPKTGEVFIGTSKGMLSFQNIFTEATTNFTDVYAYPNPVKPDFNGPILIHGMIDGAVVKILDVAGNFVYQTTSEGGQALWNGQNFSGKRVASGVYLVLSLASDGSQKVMTKIMLLN